MSKICSECQQENPSTANFCMICGTRLVENTEMDKMDELHNELSDAKDTIKVLKDVLKKQKTEKTNNNDISPDTNTVNKFCRYCGKPVSVSQQFCRHCGKPL